ncbi:UNKNOWN [Stylonychia lemnae]|uniref:C2HC/C3H-type domain-containing protein n=1 Tax=Stylonychia lemnae TaxID=5949 RepID=A0A078B771_STYLE|nr:UNKNOWN [Stylonychia lemnae]|eukprot:CDW90041.1 UNKNOWN [Stylonychia lemnae]
MEMQVQKLSRRNVNKEDNQNYKPQTSVFRDNISNFRIKATKQIKDSISNKILFKPKNVDISIESSFDSTSQQQQVQSRVGSSRSFLKFQSILMHKQQQQNDQSLIKPEQYKQSLYKKLRRKLERIDKSHLIVRNSIAIVTQDKVADNSPLRLQKDKSIQMSAKNLFDIYRDKSNIKEEDQYDPLNRLINAQIQLNQSMELSYDASRVSQFLHHEEQPQWSNERINIKNVQRRHRREYMSDRYDENQTSLQNTIEYETERPLFRNIVILEKPGLDYLLYQNIKFNFKIMNARRNASVEANDWADKKKQQLERAKQLREERKNNMIRVAEDQIVGTSSKGFGQGQAGSGGYNQMNPQASNSRSGLAGGMGGNDGYYQNQSVNGASKSGYGNMNGGYEMNNGRGNIGGGAGFGTGELRNVGYQQPGYGKGPVKATDFGMGGMNSGYQNQGYGGGRSGYDNYDQMNNLSTKSSIQTNNSYSSNINLGYNQQYDQHNNRNSNQGIYQDKRQPPQNNRNQSQRTIDYQDNRNGGGMGGPQGHQQKSSQMRGMEEQKHNNYQPSQREAPPRRAPPSNIPKGGPVNKPSSYANYDDGVSNQVIPAVAKKQQGFGANLGPDAFQAPSKLDLQECSGCGRSFNEVAYAKHSKVCKKVFQQKRKVFNSQAHRIVSNEQKQILMQAQRNDRPERNAPKANVAQQRNNMPINAKGGAPKWKKQSEQFRQALQAARGGGGGGKGGKGGKGSYQPPADEYDDRVQCPYCGRKFAEQTAQRHMPHCQNKAKESVFRGGPPKGRGGRR